MSYAGSGAGVGSAFDPVPGAQPRRVPVPKLPLHWRAYSWPIIQQDTHDPDAAVVTFLRKAAGVHTVLLYIDCLTDAAKPSRSEMEYLGDGIFAMSYRVPRRWRAGYSFYECAGFCVPWRVDAECPLDSLIDRSQTDPRNRMCCQDPQGRRLSLVEALPESRELASRPLAA